MNSLSWFLYAADTIGNLKVLCAGVLILAVALWLGLNIAVPLSEGEVLEWKDYRQWWSRGVMTIIITAIGFAILPSRNTVYAIAASQVGEQIVKSEAVQGVANDATKALQSWIKQQIKTDKNSQ